MILLLGIILFAGLCLQLYRMNTRLFFKEPLDSATTQPVTEYQSLRAGLRMQFDRPMFVTEETWSRDGFIKGQISVSLSRGRNTHFGVSYGIPFIEGKGGACPVDLTQITILDENVTACDQENIGLHAGYIKNKYSEVEYAFYIIGYDGDRLTPSEYQVYKKILTEGLFYFNE